MEKLNEETRKALVNINEGFHKEFRQVMNKDNFKQHSGMLLEELSKENPDIKKLFDYGVNLIPKDQDRPDNSLASYFLILSGLKNLNEEVMSFATDAMVYSENDQYAPMGTKSELEKIYRGKIEPLLSA